MDFPTPPELCWSMDILSSSNLLQGVDQQILPCGQGRIFWSTPVVDERMWKAAKFQFQIIQYWFQSQLLLIFVASDMQCCLSLLLASFICRIVKTGNMVLVQLSSSEPSMSHFQNILHRRSTVFVCTFARGHFVFIAPRGIWSTQKSKYK